MPILKDAEISFRVRSKMEQIARLEVLGHKDSEIAPLFNLSYGGLAMLKQRPEYKELREQLLQKHLVKLDETDAVREMLRRKAVPEAMANVLELVKQKRDLRVSLQASLEVLDRDPDQRAAKNGQGASNPVSFTIPTRIIDATLEASNKLVAPPTLKPELTASVN